MEAFFNGDEYLRTGLLPIQIYAFDEVGIDRVEAWLDGVPVELSAALTAYLDLGEPGVREFTVIAWNVSGASAMAVYQITSVGAKPLAPPPVVGISLLNPSLSSGEPAFVQVTAESEIGIDSVTVLVDGVPFDLTNDWILIIPQQEGVLEQSYEITVTATDTIGQRATGVWKLTITNRSVPPPEITLSLQDDGAFFVGQPITVFVDAKSNTEQGGLTVTVTENGEL